MPIREHDLLSEFRELIKNENLDEISSIIEEDTKKFDIFIQLLEDKEPVIRIGAQQTIYNSLNGLSDYKYLFKELIPKLEPVVLKLLDDPHPEVRQEAASLICFPSPVYGFPSYITQEPEPMVKAIPKLKELLKDIDPNVQRSAGVTLISAVSFILETKGDENEALDILSRLAVHENVLNREGVAYYSIKHIEDYPEFLDNLLPVLNELLKDPNESIRKYARDSLGLLNKISS